MTTNVMTDTVHHSLTNRRNSPRRRISLLITHEELETPLLSNETEAGQTMLPDKCCSSYLCNTLK